MNRKAITLAALLAIALPIGCTTSTDPNECTNPKYQCAGYENWYVHQPVRCDNKVCVKGAICTRKKHLGDD